MKKRGEAYIDVVVGVFLSMLILALSIELFNFFNAYHKLTYLTEQMIRVSTMEGNTKSAEVGNRYAELMEETGLGTGTSDNPGYAGTYNLKISFIGSDTVNDDLDKDGSVQLGHVIKCSTTMNIPLKLLTTSKIFKIPVSVTKSGLSEQYYKSWTSTD